MNEYSVDEIARHNTELDCWIIIGKDGDKKVYDITAFLEDHPGGPELLLDLAGQDANDEFQDIGHSREAHEMLHDLCIGIVHEDCVSQARREARKRERLSLLTHPETRLPVRSSRVWVSKNTLHSFFILAIVVAVLAIIISKLSGMGGAEDLNILESHQIISSFVKQSRTPQRFTRYD